MKDQRKTEIKVGITVIIGFIIFIWIFGWAKNFTLQSNRKTILVEFNSVAGLGIGDPVTINGVRKGYVEEMAVNGSKVLTKLNLEPDVTITEDSKFSVMMMDLMGGKKVEIVPGVSTIEIDYSKTQNGAFEGDIASAMAMLGSVQNDLIIVIKEVKTSLTILNRSLTDEKFTNDIKTAVSNLADMTGSLNKLVKDNSAEINKLIKSGNEVAKNVNELIVSNKDSLSSTITSIHETLQVSKELLTKVNNLIDQTNNSQNNLGKILNDPKLLEDLNAVIAQAKELTKILVEQLKSKGLEVNAHIF
jgi:phospholipid/cholesterol/gamma-HCH transport system substrate-binding protein